MNRKPIDLHPGAIAPVLRRLWHSAAEKLDEAQRGVEQMAAASDRIAFENGWTTFVDSLQEFWVRFFDEGKARFTAFQPWAGAIDATRKKDDLLNYLIQSRHQSQHGHIALKWSEGRLYLAPGFNGWITSTQIFPDGTYQMESTPTPGSSEVARITHDPGSAELPEIINRQRKQEFPPPSLHCGELIPNKSPIAVARMALFFYANVLRYALEKFDEHSERLPV